MKKLILMSALIASATAYGKDNTSGSDKMSVTLGGGVSQLSLASFNDMAKTNNFPQIKDGIRPTFNFGFYFRDGRSKLYSDIQLAILFGGNIKANGYKITSSAASFDVNFNYVVFENARHVFTPSLGIGWLANSVKYDANFSNQSFGQTMQNISGERTFSSNWNWYLNPRIKYDFKINKNIAVGVFAGYRVGINKPKWKVANNQKLNDAPRSTANGFYGGLQFTF